MISYKICRVSLILSIRIMVPTWVLFLIGYLFFGVLFTQLYKFAVRNSKNESASTVLLEVIAGLSILIFVPFFEIKFPTDKRVYLLMVLAGKKASLERLGPKTFCLKM